MNPDRLQLEQEIVFACVSNPMEFVRFSRALPPELFVSPRERKAMSAIHKLADSGVEINWINVQNVMGEHVATPESVTQGYANLEIAAKRLAESVMIDRALVVSQALAEEQDAFSCVQMVNALSNEYAALLSLHAEKPMTVVMSDYLAALERNAEGHILRVPTGFPTLDLWMHGGHRLGNMTFLGGSPGAGKTSFMLKLGMNAAKRGYKAVFLEGEMPTDEILSRLNGQFSGRPVHEIEGGRHMDAAMEFYEEMARVKYEVKGTFERNITSLLAHIRSACHAGAKLILVDYLQVFVEKGGRSSDEFTKIKALSEALRKATLVNNIHIIAASSLNRLDHNTGRLTLNSFYGGSQLGHDCNVGIILHDDADEVSADPNRRTVICDVVKNRGGRMGEMRIEYTLNTQDMVEQADVAIIPPVPFQERAEHEDEGFFGA